MKIKTKKTVTEEIEIDIPEYFKTDLYYIKRKENCLLCVYLRDYSVSISEMASSVVIEHQQESIQPITREEFYAQFTKAIERMTGFKYNPEDDEAVLNNFSQARDIEGERIENWQDQESDVHRDKREYITN